MITEQLPRRGEDEMNTTKNNMNNSTNNPRLPALRFPEFLGKATWAERKLSEVLIEHGAKSTGTEEVFSVSVHKGVINQIEHLGRSFAATNTENYKRVFPGDIIYTKSPTGDFPYGIIKQSKVIKPVIVSPLYGVFKPETIALGTILDAYFESSGNTINYLASIVQKGAKNTINIKNETFLSKSLILPTDKNEQQKIADCLSSLDELLAAEKQKLQALRAHKKGLMQQLFPAAGQRLPALRFAEFANDGEWEKCPLKDVFVISQGFAFSSNDSANEGTRWLKIADVGIQQMAYESPSFLPSGFKEEYQKFLVKNGDYVIALTRPILGGRLKIARVDDVFHESLLNQRVGKLVSTRNVDFVYYLLQTSKLISDIEKSIAGSEPPNLSAQQIENIEARIPKREEQQKIADCLSSLDALIAAQGQRIEALQAHKKGLMQGLFPSMKEEA